MSTVFLSLLNNTFTISRLAPTSDSHGGWVEAWAEIGSARGRMRPASATEIEIARQQQREITHVLYVVWGTDIARGDLVDGGGVTVKVLGVREPSLAGHHLQVDCRERQKGEETEEMS
jgi:SPP1 family predicted phage head-tail adaptor